WQEPLVSRIRPGEVRIRCESLSPRHRLRIVRVLGVCQPIRFSGDEVRHAFHSTGDEDVALARFDRAEGHPRGLQGRGTVTVDGGSRNRIVAKLARGDSGDVVALHPGGLRGSDHDVIDRRRIKRWHGIERGADHLSQQVIWTNILERSLHRPPNRGSSGRDDYGTAREVTPWFRVMKSAFGVWERKAGHSPPPSILTTASVMWAERGEARNTQAAPISSGEAIFPRGIVAATCSYCSKLP